MLASREWALNFRDNNEDLKNSHNGKFRESESFESALVVAMLQELIERGFTVHYIETNKGWMEIHNRKTAKWHRK